MSAESFTSTVWRLQGKLTVYKLTSFGYLSRLLQLKMNNSDQWTILLSPWTKRKSPSGQSDREHLPLSRCLEGFHNWLLIFHMASSCSTQRGPNMQPDAHFWVYGLQSSPVSRQTALRASGAEGLQGRQRQKDFWVQKKSLKPHNKVCFYVSFLAFSFINVAVLCLNLVVGALMPSPAFRRHCTLAEQTDTNNSGHLPIFR